MAEELGPLVERRRANEALAASQERFRQLHTDGIALGRLVRAIADDAGAANPGIELRIGRLPVVTGDPVGFRQLFTNLLVELSVRDNGRGIPPEHRERVFGRLGGSSSSAGTGMGLAICRKIVEVLGAAAASRATAGPTSGSCCRRRPGPAGRPAS